MNHGNPRSTGRQLQREYEAIHGYGVCKKSGVRYVPCSEGGNAMPDHIEPHSAPPFRRDPRTTDLISEHANLFLTNLSRCKETLGTDDVVFIMDTTPRARFFILPMLRNSVQDLIPSEFREVREFLSTPAALKSPTGLGYWVVAIFEEGVDCVFVALLPGSPGGDA